LTILEFIIYFKAKDTMFKRGI